MHRYSVNADPVQGITALILITTLLAYVSFSAIAGNRFRNPTERWAYFLTTWVWCVVTGVGYWEIGTLIYVGFWGVALASGWRPL